MQNLRNQLTTQTCELHQMNLERICIEVNCKHPQRGMCRKCPRIGKKLIEEVNINNLFDFLVIQQQQSNNKSYQAKAKLFQQFARQKALIVEQLHKLQRLLEQQINSLQRNLQDELSEIWFVKNQLDQNDVQALGALFSQTIVVTNNDQFKLKEVIDITTQQKCQEIISKGLTDSIRTIQSNHVNVRDYKLTQIIELGKSCQWISYNHNESQIVTAVETQINTFTISNQGIWINDQSPLIGHTDDISQVKFNHNSTLIASCGADKLVIVWNKHNNGKWQQLCRLTNHTSQVLSICFSNDSTKLVSGGSEDTIFIYALNNVNGKWECIQKLTDHTSFVLDVCFNSISTLLASGSMDNSIIIWYSNGSCQWRISQKLTGHQQCVYRVSFNSNSTQLVSGSFDKTIKVWLIDHQHHWKCIHTLSGHTDSVHSVCFNKQSNMIVSSSLDKSIKIWRIQQANNWICTQTIQEHVKYVLCSIVSRDSTMIISGSDDNTVMIHKLM